MSAFTPNSDDSDFEDFAEEDPLSSWRSSRNYYLKRTIGRGSYGEVVEAEDVRSKQPVAIKRVQDIVESILDAKRIYREIHILRHTSHPNIVRLLTVEAPHLRPTNTILRDTSNSTSVKRGRPTDHSLDDLYLVFELVDTDLNKLLLSSQYLSTLHIQTFLYQILLGMLYLHSANIIHRDLKPANILIYENCHVKICDFGLSRIMSSAGDNSPSRTQSLASDSSSPFSKLRPSSSSSSPFPFFWDQPSSHDLLGQHVQRENDSQPAGVTSPSAQSTGTLRSMSMSPRSIDPSSLSASDSSTPPLQQLPVHPEQSGMVSFNLDGSSKDISRSSNKNENHSNGIAMSHFDSGMTSSSSAISLSDGLGLPMPPPIMRQMTHHVVTRWYRAPELILLCDYSKPVDMWSVGCILAELLGMQSESVPDFQMRAPLFPGASCPSLSGDGLTDPFNTSNFVGHGTETDYDRVDQLNLILDVIGTPSEECIGSVRNPTTEKFLRGLRKRPAQSLSRRYPGAPPEAISLLQQMLHFDPAKRLTVEQALAHPYMKAVRDESREIRCSTLLDTEIENVADGDGAAIFQNLKKEIMTFRK